MRRMPSAASVDVEAQRLGDPLAHRALRRPSRSSVHLAAEEAVGAEPAEHQVGVGDGRLGAAAAVAGRTGHRAGALRADAQRLPVSTRAIEPPPVPTSWMSIIGIWTGSACVVAADQRRAGRQHLAVVDHAGLGGGAAHVEGDGVVDAELCAQRLGADHAGGRPGFEHADALAPAPAARRNRPPVDCTIRNVAAEALRSRRCALDLAEIAANARPDIGVGDRRRGALELAVLLRQLVRGARRRCSG